MPWKIPFSGSCEAVAIFCERLNMTSSSEKKESRAYTITHSFAQVVSISAASLPFCSHSTAWTLTIIPCRVKARR